MGSAKTGKDFGQPVRIWSLESGIDTSAVWHKMWHIYITGVWMTWPDVCVLRLGTLSMCKQRRTNWSLNQNVPEACDRAVSRDVQGFQIWQFVVTKLLRVMS